MKKPNITIQNTYTYSNDDKYFVYGHYTKDNIILFYVGYSQLKHDSINVFRQEKFANKRDRRKDKWANIADKGFISIVLGIFKTKEDAIVKVKELILFNKETVINSGHNIGIKNEFVETKKLGRKRIYKPVIGNNTKTGECIEYNSVYEASKKLNLSHSNIHTSMKYNWRVKGWRFTSKQQ